MRWNVVHIFKRLIYAGIESTHAEVLVIIEAVEEGPIGLDVVVQPAQVLSFLEWCTEGTRESPEIATEGNGILQGLIRALEIPVKEEFILPDRSAEVCAELLSAKGEGGLSRCDRRNARRSLVAAAIV